MTNWGDMPPELKWMIVDRMDIVTRFRLKMCSKSDKSIVESVPFDCDRVKVIPRYFCDDEQKKLLWEWSIPEGRVRYEEDSTLSIKIEYKERFIKLSSEKECSEMVRCMFRAYILPQNVRMRWFCTFMNLDCLFPNRDIKIHAYQVQLCVENREDNKAWLDVLAKPPAILYIKHGWDGIGSHPMVQNVNRLTLDDPLDVENEHLMNFKATKMHIYSSKVTEEGINAYIKKLINDDYPIGSSMNFRRDVNSTWDKIIEGLDYKVIPKPKKEEEYDWTDDDDEEEAADGDDNMDDDMEEDDVDMESSDDEEEEEEEDESIRGYIEARVNMSSEKDIIVKQEWDNAPKYSPTKPEYKVHLKIVKKGEV